MTTEKFKELQELVWQTHCEKGFDKIENSDVRNLNLIIGEISEAYEEYRSGHRELYYVDNKPEGEFIELADVVIRILNYYNENGLFFDDYKVFYPDYTYKTIDKFYHYLYIESINGSMYKIVSIIDKYLTFHNQDLEELIRIKNAYNQTREYLHGKKF